MKIKSINLGLAGLMIAVVSSIAGCDRVNDVETVKPYRTDGFEIVKGFQIEDREAFEIVDTDTGVHYLVITDTLSSSSGSAITILYNTDGTLKVD